jgi:hypothetical protein
VNPGGEPERDDTGLPPVDIEVPDDARELDRDVQAYRRELRALRRSERHGRWHRSLSKDGVVLPLLACCLILALITGTLLTVFTATSRQSLTGPPGPATSAPTRPGAQSAKIVRTQTVPHAVLTVGGASIPLQGFGRDMMLLVPPRCGCARTLNWLVEVASRASASVFLIYMPPTKSEVESLYRQVDSQLRGRVQLASETDNVLSQAEVAAGIPADELTAILLSPDSATWVSQLNPRDDPAPLIRALTGQSA